MLPELYGNMRKISLEIKWAVCYSTANSLRSIFSPISRLSLAVWQLLLKYLTSYINNAPSSLSKILAISLLFFISCRWKIGEDGLIAQKQDKNVLEFVAVKSPQSLKWAMPGVRCRNDSFFLNILYFAYNDNYNYTLQQLSNPPPPPPSHSLTTDDAVYHLPQLRSSVRNQSGLNAASFPWFFFRLALK